MAHLRLPEPYDFELSTSRFRRWGMRSREPLGRRSAVARGRRARSADRAGERRRRRRAARCSDRLRGAKAARRRVRPRRFRGLRRDRARPREDRSGAARAEAAARAGPVRVARHVDHGAAGLAACGLRHPQQVRRALRNSCRPRLVVPRARARGGRGGAGARGARLLAPEGRVRRRARALRRGSRRGSRRFRTTR